MFDDNYVEPSEDFFLTIQKTGGAGQVVDSQGQGVITNDDAAPGSGTAVAPCFLLCLGGGSSGFFSSIFGGDLSSIFGSSLFGGLFKNPPSFSIFGNFPFAGLFGSDILAILFGKKKGGAATAAAVPIATASAVVTQAGQKQVTWSMTRQGAKQLRKSRKATLSVTMTFTDVTGARVTQSVPIQFKNKKKKKKK